MAEDITPNDALYAMRHSAAHIMAEAVLELVPGAKFAIGPPIEHGFYYDFELPESLTNDDLAKIDRRMRRTIKRNVAFEHSEISKDEARQMFVDQPYKLELIDGIEDDHVSIYAHGKFVDLCEGPHVKRSGKVGAFKLTSIAGAYWRGDENNTMLQRIYGALFETQEDLDAHLERVEDAQRRDHRRLGRELELFTTHEDIGAGLPLWLPKGATVRRKLEEFITGLEREAGYQHVYSPHLAKRELFERSGHWDHFKDDMFPPMDLDHEQMVLRPMNCPHHILIYSSKLRSYRELPLRLAEMGTMYRWERSGVIGGLSRVRAMTLNDAHIFCEPSQVKEEFSGVMQLVERAYDILGITEYSYQLSLRDPDDKEKYVDNDEMWDMAEDILREAMDDLGLPYTEATGEAAFYGPKLDIQFADLMGREETYSTVQIDFHLPKQFDLSYIGEDGAEHQPVIIHRGVLSTMERMMAYLIELYGGAFPLWLAPVQAVVIPIADRHIDYARRVAVDLRAVDLRVELDDRGERMQAKIRDAQLQKVPYMLVVGDKEEEAGTVAVRQRSGEDLGALPVFQVIDRLQDEITTAMKSE
ncbi:MAG: threonine--tRNA ligase [Chloroflexi bacterium]|nr:threonine--tRNA ligase [Chloroflexota bacterium]